MARPSIFSQDVFTYSAATVEHTCQVPQVADGLLHVIMMANESTASTPSMSIADAGWIPILHVGTGLSDCHTQSWYRRSEDWTGGDVVVDQTSTRRAVIFTAVVQDVIEAPDTPIDTPTYGETYQGADGTSVPLELIAAQTKPDADTLWMLFGASDGDDCVIRLDGPHTEQDHAIAGAVTVSSGTSVAWGTHVDSTNANFTMVKVDGAAAQSFALVGGIGGWANIFSRDGVLSESISKVDGVDAPSVKTVDGVGTGL